MPLSGNIPSVYRFKHGAALLFGMRAVVVTAVSVVGNKFAHSAGQRFKLEKVKAFKVKQ